MELRRSSSGELIRITTAAALGVGGEARIYAVAGDETLAAKLYHRPTRERAAKLSAMLANPPEDPMSGQGHVSIAWPVDLLTSPQDGSQVLGFLMPRVKEMSPIIDFYHPKTRRKKHPFFNYRYLLRTARNLAACVSALHKRGYVIGDLNESNILVGDTALVTLVDTDSFQVPDPGSERTHRCRVGKPEFTPPELQNVRFEWVDRKQEHDLFGLGVLLFQLLMEGVHPFAGRHTGRGEPAPLEERITTGAFPYDPGARSGVLPMPTAPLIESLNSSVYRLFLRCFIEGRADPTSRPNAQAWQQALFEAESSLTTCTVNDQHFHGNHLTTCPWCQRQGLFQGLDPFPSREAIQAVRSKGPRSRISPWRKPVWRGPVDHETAVAIALADIERKRKELVFTAVMAVVGGGGLIAYWWWVILLAILER